MEVGKTLPMNEISGYVTSEYDWSWWVGRVLSKDNEREDVEFSTQTLSLKSEQTTNLD